MGRAIINSVAKFGIVKDLPAHLLPPGAWTDGRNVRFGSDKASKFLGNVEVFSTPPVGPEWAMPVQTASGNYWLYFSLTKGYTVIGGVHTNLTRQTAGSDVDYTGAIDNYWSGGILGGIPVVNNGVDVPQAWNPVDVTQRLVDLPAWPPGVTAKIVKPFKNFLIAMNIIDNGTERPHMVWWSTSADPGTLPATWDVLDATQDAGQFELTDTNAGIIQDGEALGDIFVIYKDSSTHGMQLDRSAFIWRQFDIFTATGILGQRSVVTVPAKAGRAPVHFLATGDDIIINDGRSGVSILDKRMRKFLNSNLDTTYFRRSYATINGRRDEALFCFPENGASRPTLAIVWNYIDNTLGVRELQNAAFIGFGLVDLTAALTWDGVTGTWDEQKLLWNTRSFNPQQQDMLLCDPVASKFQHLDQGNQNDGADMNVLLERVGHTIVPGQSGGQPITSLRRRKLLHRVWPRMVGGPVQVQVGAQEDITLPIAWGEVKSFDPATQKFVDAKATGRLLAIRFSSATDVAWDLEGYDLEMELLGEL